MRTQGTHRNQPRATFALPVNYTRPRRRALLLIRFGRHQGDLYGIGGKQGCRRFCAAKVRLELPRGYRQCLPPLFPFSRYGARSSPRANKVGRRLKFKRLLASCAARWVD